jgi:hypothetical protein
VSWYICKLAIFGAQQQSLISIKRIAVGNPIIKRKIEITLTGITRYILASIPSQYL